MLLAKSRRLAEWIASVVEKSCLGLLLRSRSGGMKEIDTDKLIASRRELLFSQEELAIAASIDVRTVQRAEAGARTSAETRKALAAVLGGCIYVTQPAHPVRPVSYWAALFVGCTGGAAGALSGFQASGPTNDFGSLLGLTGFAAGIAGAAVFALRARERRSVPSGWQRRQA